MVIFSRTDCLLDNLIFGCHSTKDLTAILFIDEVNNINVTSNNVIKIKEIKE